MNDMPTLPVSQLYEEAENEGANRSANPTMGDVIAERLSRRDLVKGILAVTAISAVMPSVAEIARAATDEATPADTTPSFSFTEVAAGSDEYHHVAEGYDAQVLIRWGDKVLPDAPDFDPLQQAPESQAKQFGYNNDFVGYIPLDDSEDHGLFVVNHEYTNVELMFPGGGAMTQDNKFAGITKTLVDIEMMAHGGSVLEVRREGMARRPGFGIRPADHRRD
jgi:secreted PhoX family phosphatase